MERLNQALDRLAAAVEQAVEHIHQDAPATDHVDEAAARVEDLASKLERRVPETPVPETPVEAPVETPATEVPAETPADVPTDKPVT